jgi:PAS domain S-box-containing protein
MNTPYGVFATDAQGRYLQVNPSACCITGYEERELLAMSISDLLFEDSREVGLLHFQKLVDEGKSQDEMPFRPKSGEKRWWSVTAVRLSGNRFLGFCNDITDRKQAEEQRSHLQAHLQQAQKMEAIGTLAGGIAHDFNNILGAILGYAEMAQDDSPAGSILRHDIDEVVKASHRAKELVKQILAFSLQTETVLIPIQPAIIVGEAVKMLRSSLPSSIDIRQNIDARTGPILAHPIQIHQIVMNLGTNAFHAMEENGGTLSISLEKKTLFEKDIVGKPGVLPGDFVQLSIGDTGTGIAPELWGKIFDPYFTTKQIGKGTGMGLSIIHGIVKSYGGCVSFHSRPGKGTVFQVLLPVMAAETVVEVKPAEIVELGNERILFIDDEEILAEMGKSMLERLGYQVTVRSSSLEALTTFQNQPDIFDLVITDQTMPGMTGSDLARRILQIRPFMPIILCTGYSSLISEEKVRSLGIKGFAMKPLARKDIAAIIRKVLDKRVGDQGE